MVAGWVQGRATNYWEENKEAGPWAEVETSPLEEAPLLSTSHM